MSGRSFSGFQGSKSWVGGKGIWEKVKSSVGHFPSRQLRSWAGLGLAYPSGIDFRELFLVLVLQICAQTRPSNIRDPGLILWAKAPGLSPYYLPCCIVIWLVLGIAVFQPIGVSWLELSYLLTKLSPLNITARLGHLSIGLGPLGWTRDWKIWYFWVYQNTDLIF